MWTLTALGCDVTRAPDITIIPELPLTDAGWTLCSAHTSDEQSANSIFTNNPGAGTVSVQIDGVIFLLEDWRPLVHLSSGLIAAKKGWPHLSCCSGGGQCDGFAATWWTWWRIRTLKINNLPPPLPPPPLSLQSAPEQRKILSKHNIKCRSINK